MTSDEVVATETGVIFGICVDGDQVAICELSDEGRKLVAEGGSPETWEDWGDWFPLAKLPEELTTLINE